MKIRFLTIMTLCILLSSTAFGAAKQTSNPASKPISFAVATDIHYLSNSLTDHKKAFNDFVISGDGKQLGNIDALTNAFLYEVKKRKLDFLILSGDLTNNGEKKSHTDLAKKLAMVSAAGIKVFVIPGNHDVNNPYARGFKGDSQYVVPSISAKDFSKIYWNFGYSSAISRDSASLSYLAKPTDKLWLLMLDSCQYADNAVLGFPVTNGDLKLATRAWIQRCSKLAKDHNATIITVMHHNLIDHFKALSSGFTIDDSASVASLFQANRLNITLSGHIHIQDIKSTRVGSKTLYDIATSAMSVFPHHYGLMTYTPSAGLDYKTVAINVNSWAKVTGQQDRKLLDFFSYSKTEFMKASYNRSYNRLLENNDYSKYTKAQLSQMADTMVQVNLSIFSGTGSKDYKRIQALPGYRLWQSSSSSFLQSYILNAANISPTSENNFLHLSASSLR